MGEGRSCIICGAPVLRSKTERPSQFARKITCSRRCGIAVANRKRWPLSPEGRIRSSCSVDGVTGCWRWLGRVNDDGYGKLRIAGHLFAHRLSYATFCGPIPRGVMVLHSCDTPGCVNPDHLFLGSGDDNMADMAAKGRAVCPSRKLDAAAVLDIRASALSGAKLAAKYGVTSAAVSAVRRGKTWVSVASQRILEGH